MIFLSDTLKALKRTGKNMFEKITYNLFFDIQMYIKYNFE